MSQRKTAYLFPGQGSQKVGMGASLYEAYPEARAVFDAANAAAGFDLKAICFEGPEDELKDTQNAQAALFTAGIAALRAFQTVYPAQPSATAGHSVGEYAALVAAGCLDFGDGLKLVLTRGGLMKEAAVRSPGGMAAILGLDSEQARAACDQARAEGAGLVTVANYNGGGQVVISGVPSALERAGAIALEKGARRVIPLSVSGAFHSPLMVSAGDALFTSLSNTAFRKPEIPIVTNVDARYVEQPSDVTAGLTMQVSGSVRWEESMLLLLRDGINTVIEFGSGEVLCGLMKRIAPKGAVSTAAVFDTDSLTSAVDLLNSEESF